LSDDLFEMKSCGFAQIDTAADKSSTFIINSAKPLIAMEDK
jgi:hypothetical protein